eukprot:TRINITY_DN18821_c0_g1_i1.p1 TRINITY_DN18821_c0_g1~~TRINITY_DN18821_c0_g1_i1.p1  ORF type:complete len:256 (-),score=48.58 TRINITY_DN18821_c0_g1_i1:68-796(-)
MSTNNFEEEDEDYIETINNTFEKAWHEINLGPEIMKEYIKYCQTGGNIPCLFFRRLNKQLRERILHFTCSLDLPDGISMDTAYNMFSKNLYKASMLTYLYIFNVADLDVEVDFLLGYEDKTQWNAAQTEAISAISLSTMLLNMVVSQETKEAPYKEFFSCTFPILRDRTVLILTILLTIFDQVHDEKIEQLKDDLSTLLQRYLEEKEQSMETISTCIDNLHKVCQIFKDLKRDENTNPTQHF